ncbi:MAG: hypothetical protein K6F33_13525 [Bacteroidales bacterium]|nr:hypothetical protein [Bacteroidales bacterium]
MNGISSHHTMQSLSQKETILSMIGNAVHDADPTAETIPLLARYAIDYCNGLISKLNANFAAGWNTLNIRIPRS